MKNSKKELLLSALLTNPTIKQAAESTGVPLTTAYNWLRKPDFSEEYQRRKRQAVSEASDFLQSKINKATQIIAEIMDDEGVPPQTRLAAARNILDFGYKVIEQREIVARIEAVEQHIKEDMGNNGQ